MIERTLSFAHDKVAQGQKIAWITVTKTHGSSPASAGQVMVVATDGETSGTIGGGASEYRIVQQALQAMQSAQHVFTFAIDHAQEGMVCGGGMEGVGTVLGQEARLVVFGGGHVSQQLAPMATATGFSVHIVEDRPELASAFSGVHFHVCTPDEYDANALVSPADYAVICTRGHATDSDALGYCLRQSPRYIGMIGSRRKVLTLTESLRTQGTPPQTLERLYAPIGLDIAKEKPAEIAVSILAEILLVKNNGTPRHLRDTLPQASANATDGEKSNA